MIIRLAALVMLGAMTCAGVFLVLDLYAWPGTA
jgi:hypothetical protein